MEKKELTILDWALIYAKSGLRIFPVNGKRPHTSSWLDAGTTDEEVIKAWFGKSSNTLGIGIIIPEDIVIIDCDSVKAEKTLNDNGYSLPLTMTAVTGKGKHFWYRIKPGEKIKRTIRVLPEVDLLVNGYVVAPPSPCSGSTNRHYEWMDGFYPDSVSVCPDWLLTINNQAKKELNKRIDPDELLDGVQPGQRQTALFRYACWLRGDSKRTKREAVVLLTEVVKRSRGTEGYEREPDVQALVDRVWNTYDENDQGDKKQKPKIWTLSELLDSNLPPPSYLVEGMIQSQGVHLLWADPKAAKSCLMTYVALCVASGIPLWGKFPTNKTGVLYLDLEQGETFAADRLAKIMSSVSITRPPGFYASFNWPTATEGGLEQIREFLYEHTDVGMVVIDTMADMWPEMKGEGSGGNEYKADQKAMREFKKIASELGVCVVLVHHSNKSGSHSGSQAITGKSDSIWHLKKPEDEIFGTVKTKGKNVESMTLMLQFDKRTLTWKWRGTLRE